MLQLESREGHGTTIRVSLPEAIRPAAGTAEVCS
jgi:hypothetical protein